MSAMSRSASAVIPAVGTAAPSSRGTVAGAGTIQPPAGSLTYSVDRVADVEPCDAVTPGDRRSRAVHADDQWEDDLVLSLCYPGYREVTVVVGGLRRESHLDQAAPVGPGF